MGQTEDEFDLILRNGRVFSTGGLVEPVGAPVNFQETIPAGS